MIKKIFISRLALFYAILSLVIFDIRIDHHSSKTDDSEWTSYATNLSSCYCYGKGDLCINCDDIWWEECCENESSCFAECSKWVWLYAYTNPKDDSDQIISNRDATPSLYSKPNHKISEYKIIWYKNKIPIYQASQTPHYRVGIIELLV